VHVLGVVISRPRGQRVRAYVTTPWSPEVLDVLVDEEVAALTLGADSQVGTPDGLAGLDRLTELRSLEIDWVRTPAVPETTLRQLDELAVTGRSGWRVPLSSIPRVQSLEYRPGRIVGALAALPDLEVVTTRGMPAEGLGVFDSCSALRLVRMTGRGVTALQWDSAPRALTSVILAGVALTSLDGVEDLPVLNDLTVEGGRAAAGFTLDLAPLGRCTRLRVFAATGYAAYVGADGVRGGLDRLALAAR
jgi:hypothetical protein